MNLIYCTQQLNSHEICIKHLEQMRWNGTPVCPYCGCDKSTPKKLRHTCSGCSRSFSVTVGTVFQHTKLPMNKWFVAITLILSSKKGISSLQLARQLSVNKNTAWLLQMKIRVALEEGELEGFNSKSLINKLVKFRKRNKTTVPRQRIRFSFRKSDIHTENFGIYLKRAIYGQYHQIEEFFLHRYMDEFKFKLTVKNAEDYGYAELMKRFAL
jgi:transposase-like protein